MTENELRWAHMTAEELVNELTISSDVSPLVAILVARLDEVLEKLAVLQPGFGEHD